MSSLSQVHPHFVAQFWPQIGRMLERGLEHSAGEYSADQLKVMLVRGEQTLLIAQDEEGNIKGAATVLFENFPNFRSAFITDIGGRLIASQELFALLVDWCVSQGASKIRGCASDEVTRLWRQKFGFQHRYNLVERDIP